MHIFLATFIVTRLMVEKEILEENISPLDLNRGPRKGISCFRNISPSPHMTCGVQSTLMWGGGLMLQKHDVYFRRSGLLQGGFYNCKAHITKSPTFVRPTSIKHLKRKRKKNYCISSSFWNFLYNSNGHKDVKKIKIHNLDKVEWSFMENDNTYLSWNRKDVHVLK